MINRETYLSQLVSLRNQNLIKVITGIRRCGKSTLMAEYIEWLKSDGVSESQIIFLNFEEREKSQFLDWQSVYDHIINKLSPNVTRYVFLDEIQILPQF